MENVTVQCDGQWKYRSKFLEAKGLLLYLEIHHKHRGTEGLCNNESSNCFFPKAISSVDTFSLFTMSFLAIFVLLVFCHEKKYAKRYS